VSLDEQQPAALEAGSVRRTGGPAVHPSGHPGEGAELIDDQQPNRKRAGPRESFADGDVDARMCTLSSQPYLRHGALILICFR